MEERRKSPRMKEENEVTITVVSEEKDLPREKIIDNFTKDLSESGARIQTHILLPVDSLIELEFTSKGVREQISALGKVKWVKVIIDDESYEAGLEFCGTPGDAIKKLGEYISWKLKATSRLKKNKFSPADFNNATVAENEEASPVDPENTNVADNDVRPPGRNRRWIKITMVSLCAVILTAVLLNLSGYIPEFDTVSGPDAGQTATGQDSPAPVNTAPDASPAPSPVAAPVPEAIPAPEVKQNIKVIGNSDSKRYHLPGMKYYNSVKAYHRVEFESEDDAIKAGYSKASQ